MGVLTLFAAGGVVFLVFHDVAPESLEEGQWLPTTGASLGFLVALVGHAIVG